jgi:signal transduction histidine kinase
MLDSDSRVPASALQGAGIRALVVDDEEILSSLYSDILQLKLKTKPVMKAASIREALRMGEHPDVVMLDLGLPDSVGLSGLAALCERWPEAAIIIVSGNDDEGLAGEALRRGAQDYLHKGRLDASTLVRSVRYALERKSAEQEHARMEVALRHAQKLESIGQLAAGIAHEINTPAQYIGDNVLFLRESFQDLSAFLSTQKALLDSPEEPELLDRARQAWKDAELEFLQEEIPKALQQCLEGVARVSRIVGAMKEFSHPDNETHSRLDLNRAIESTVTVCRNEWKYVAEMDLDLDPTLPPLLCFPGELNQAVLNLVINSAHAIAEQLQVTGEEKGRITIRTRQTLEMVEIHVEDTGTGIPESIQARIFDPFFTTKPVGKGTGQGLAIVHAVVVEKHGGTIELQSKEGCGSTFILRIPLREA